MKQLRSITLQKYKDIQAAFTCRYAMGLRRSLIVEQLAKEFYLSQSRIEQVICLDLNEYEVRVEKS